MVNLFQLLEVWGIDLKVNMKNLKLKWKITFYFLLFSILLISILWFFQIILLEDMYVQKRTTEVENAIELVEDNINNEAIHDIIKKIETEQNISITPTREFIPINYDYRREPKEKKPIILTKEKNFILSNGRELNLTFNAMLTPVDSTIDTLKTQLIIITIVMLFLSLLMSIIISKRIATPIEKINTSAKFLSNGEYDITFDGDGFLEISELSETLNITTVELSKIEKFRKELIANISHDLRTPLSLIYSYAEMMYDFPDEMTSDKTKIIMEETKRLNSLVNDLLSMSQLESKTLKLSESKFNITKEIKDIIYRTKELVKDYNIEFVYDEDVWVKADKTKISQVFYNLLINAINYTGEDKKVTILQKVRDDSFRIEVIDTGDGIDEELLPYIWDRYFKSNKYHKRSVMGTGIGLSIVKKIVKLHNGKYGVYSNNKQGSIFWFELNI